MKQQKQVPRIIRQKKEWKEYLIDNGWTIVDANGTSN